MRSELSKLRGVLFHKVVEDLHLHLYNKGEYRFVGLLDHLFRNNNLFLCKGFHTVSLDSDVDFSIFS